MATATCPSSFSFRRNDAPDEEGRAVNTRARQQAKHPRGRRLRADGREADGEQAKRELKSSGCHLVSATAPKAASASQARQAASPSTVISRGPCASLLTLSAALSLQFASEAGGGCSQELFCSACRR